MKTGKLTKVDPEPYEALYKAMTGAKRPSLCIDKPKFNREWLVQAVVAGKDVAIVVPTRELSNWLFPVLRMMFRGAAGVRAITPLHEVKFINGGSVRLINANSNLVHGIRVDVAFVVCSDVYRQWFWAAILSLCDKQVFISELEAVEL